MPQTDYSVDQPSGRAGMLADENKLTKIFSKRSDDVIPFGRLVSIDDADDKVKIPTEAADIQSNGNFGKCMGVALSTYSEHNTTQAVPSHPAGEVFPVVRKGRVWVEVETDVVKGEGAYARFLANPGANEHSLIEFDNVPTGGTWTISVTVDGVTAVTAPIAYNANAAAIQAALIALSNVPAGGVVVTGSYGAGFDLEWSGALGLRPMVDPVVDDSALEYKVAKVNTYAVLNNTPAAFTITINGNAYTFTATTESITDIRDALVTAINAGADPVTAAPVSTDSLTVTADVAGVAFTSAVTANISDTATQPNVDDPVVSTVAEDVPGEYAEDKLGAFRNDEDDASGDSHAQEVSVFGSSASRGGIAILDLDLI